MKIKLVHFNNEFGKFVYPAFADCFSNYFELEEYDTTKTYDKASTVFVINTHQYIFVNHLVNDGYKVLVENLQENSINTPLSGERVQHMICVHDTRITDMITVPLYFWYKESRQFDYRSLPRTNTADLKFLLMMNYQRGFRDAIHYVFDDIRNEGLYSYVSHGIQMPRDIRQSQPHWDRYINAEWYNRTQFSVVVETAMTRGPREVFITEKTTKPLAMRHPFITLACPETLALLRAAGFETYNNLFDETYDTVLDEHERIRNVYQQVKNYNHNGYDKITQDKIDYNYNYFYDYNQVNKRFTQDIVTPILEFANE
jgi:hypothetical protein